MIPNIPWKPIGYIIAAIAAIWLLWQGYNLLTAGHKTKARLGENQTEAAAESGSDAVNTLGDQNDSETETDGKVKGVQDAIDDARNPGDVDAAGRNGLCDISPDLCDEKPVLTPAP